MEMYNLNQWLVKIGEKEEALFTPLGCVRETAMAIAVSTFGQGVTGLQDEGIIRVELSNPQLHVADSRNCAHCGCYRTHDEDCVEAVVAHV